MLFLTSYATEKVHIYAADSLSSTITVYNHIKKNKNTDLAIANSISDALDICAKDDLIRQKSLLLTSTQTETSNSRVYNCKRAANSKRQCQQCSSAIQTILFAFIINYILETSSRTYNKAY
ncbi:hypothetical protein HBI24_237540 [Parastagonospora nodorum]|nr:hypothetical protein HBI24_237540 [Parastagonospora nodorum]